VVKIDPRPESTPEGDHAERWSFLAKFAGNGACEELTHSVFDRRTERLPMSSRVLFEISH